MLRRILTAVCLAPLAAGLWQCNQAKPKPAGPSPYAATVVLKFTPMAQAALVKNKDTLVVNAYYYGDPTPQAAARADRLGRLELADEYDGWANNARRVPVAGHIDTALLPQIRGEPQLLVDVYSVTTIGAQDDLLHCKTWIGTVKMAQARSPVIGCELENGDKDSADDLVPADDASSSE
jgi:hypothetical protein